MDYSQRGEQIKIIEFFGTEFVGNCLDIGANDGKTLSNTLACIERGWGGLMIEPSKKSYNSLYNLHKNNKKVECLNFAISDKGGVVDFYESGSHLGTGDHSLVSTIKRNIRDWWAPYNSYEQTVVTCLTFDEMMVLSPYSQYDLISIDVEGVDYEILSQINLTNIGCKMLIVESNQNSDQQYINYATKFGMRFYHRTYENLIFVK